MANTLTKTQVKNLMAKAGIVPVSLSGRGTDWEVELTDEKTQRKFFRQVAKVGGFRTGCGHWILRPGYQSMGDWSDKSSRWHY
jgi:hypothetical protein